LRRGRQQACSVQGGEGEREFWIGEAAPVSAGKQYIQQGGEVSAVQKYRLHLLLEEGDSDL